MNPLRPNTPIPPVTPIPTVAPTASAQDNNGSAPQPASEQAIPDLEKRVIQAIDDLLVASEALSPDELRALIAKVQIFQRELMQNK